MYSGILMTTSGECKNYQRQHKQMSGTNTIVPPEFPPIHPRFGGNQYENFHIQPQSSNHPAYQEHVPVHQTQNQGFGFEMGQMTNNTPVYPEGSIYDYSQQQGGTNYMPSQQAHAPMVQRFNENVLVVEVEPSISPMTKPRLRWTKELHERFTCAVEELGGCFKAKPKAILQKMNVRGVTKEQLKSHLQKVRKNVLYTSSSANGILNGQALGMPNFEANIDEHKRLQMRCVGPNNYCNYRIAIVNEQPANNVKFDFKNYGCSTSSQTSTYNQILTNATCRSHVDDVKFQDFDFY